MVKKDPFDKFDEDVGKINNLSSSLSEADLAKISGWLSTGYPAINAVISGDLYHGIPKGRVTTLFGPSQSGKSLLSALIQKSAQDQGMRVIIFDSEFDKDGRMEQSFGVDTDKVRTLPIDTVEQLIIQSQKILNSIIDNNIHGQVLLVLDSLGGLSTDKSSKDSGQNKVAQDMGLRAKLIREFYRSMKAKTAFSRCPFLIINHESKDPSQMHESIFKKQGGGEAIEFFSTVMCNISAKKEKQDASNEKDIEAIMAKANTTGQYIRCFTQKNRCAIPHQQAEVYLNFVSGIDKFSGLKSFIDKMEERGMIYLKSSKGEIGKGRNYYMEIDGEEVKLGEYKEWRHNAEIFEKYLFPQMNKVVQEEMHFRTHEL